jgi:aspartyl-tRNA(Asn)/glutamyl-tRNA(Gln) amidotransferase subunit A
MLERTLLQVAKALTQREVSCRELTLMCVDEIEKNDAALGAFLCVDRAGALLQAEASDQRRASGHSLGALDGIPLAVKDNILQLGLPCTAGSKMLKHFHPVYEAHAVAQLRSGGAVLLGKTNLDEFGMGSSTENSAYQKTKNPYDMARVPGGSSGGSAAAVAARMAFGSVGTDTGGSVRQPASFTNVVALKPTYGRISRHGVVAYASSLDQIGPLARTVDDVSALYAAMAGHDPQDGTSARQAVQVGVAFPLHGKVLGIPKEYVSEGVAPEVRGVFENARKVFENLGAQVKEVSLPHTRSALAAYYILASAEASSNLARYDGVRFGFRSANAKTLDDVFAHSRAQGFGSEVKRRIMLGTFVLSAGFQDAYYGQAQKMRLRVREDFRRAFEACDVLCSPVSPALPWKLGEKIDDPLQMYLMDALTVPSSLAGIPALSMPAGFVGELPVGIQLMAPHFEEGRLLAVAKQFEAQMPFHTRRPALKNAPESTGS